MNNTRLNDSAMCSATTALTFSRCGHAIHDCHPAASAVRGCYLRRQCILSGPHKRIVFVASSRTSHTPALTMQRTVHAVMEHAVLCPSTLLAYVGNIALPACSHRCWQSVALPAPGFRAGFEHSLLTPWHAQVRLGQPRWRCMHWVIGVKWFGGGLIPC